MLLRRAAAKLSQFRLSVFLTVPQTLRFKPYMPGAPTTAPIVRFWSVSAASALQRWHSRGVPTLNLSTAGSMQTWFAESHRRRLIDRDSRCRRAAHLGTSLCS
jgi:hypothetical protein